MPSWRNGKGPLKVCVSILDKFKPWPAPCPILLGYSMAICRELADKCWGWSDDKADKVCNAKWCKYFHIAATLASCNGGRRFGPILDCIGDIAVRWIAVGNMHARLVVYGPRYIG